MVVGGKTIYLLILYIMSFNQNAGYGNAMFSAIHSAVGTFGNVMVVMNSSDSDEKNYQHIQELFT
jgi:hypothetical protein